MALIPTPSQTVGPYFHLGLTDQRSITRLVTPATKGERVHLTCRVLDETGETLNDAMLELWQADANGKYNSPEDDQKKPADAHFRGFGRMGTAKDGTCSFETIKPGRVPGADGTLQAPHINVSVFARGLLKRLPTRIYFAGDPANAADPVLELVPETRRQTLMAQADPVRPGHWLFVIHLRGENETVFFDV